MYLKQAVFYQGIELKPGTEIPTDHPEFEDFQNQGWLTSSKTIANGNPEGFEKALGDTEATIANLTKELADEKAKNETLAEDLEKALGLVKELQTPAKK